MWSLPGGLQGSHTSLIMMVTRRWFGSGLQFPPGLPGWHQISKHCLHTALEV